MGQRLLTFIALGIAATAAGQDGDANLKAIQGKWHLQALTVDGKELGAKVIGDSTLTFGAGDYVGGKDGKSTGRGTFKLDAAKKPKAIDLTPAQGEAKGKTLLGIYEITGDTLKLCIGLPDKARPGEFTAKTGSGHILQVLTRAKSK